MDTFRKVARGAPQVIPAAAYNAFVDAASDYEQRRRLGNAGPGRGITVPSDLVKVRNDTGGDLARGSAVELGDTIVDAERGYLWFEGNTRGTPGRPMAVYLRPCPSGEIEWAQVSGVCLAIVNVQSVNDHRCHPVDSSTVLKGGLGGPFELVQHSGETGEQECVVKLGLGGAWVIAKAPAGGIAAMSGSTPGSAECSLYRLGSGGDLEQVTGSLTIYHAGGGAVGANAYIQFKVDADGTCWADWEDCS